MGQITKIAWCDHTFNPWMGCTKVDSACANCYAETLMDKRWGRVKWGPAGKRARTSPANWKLPLAWNATAKNFGERRRVFCASLADILDDHESISEEWRSDLRELIAETPWLDWLLLTKRPENAHLMYPLKQKAVGTEVMCMSYMAPAQQLWPDNVWLGASAGDQAAVDRVVPLLMDVPAAVRFLSIEPLLEAVDIGKFTVTSRRRWVIVGGESEQMGRCRPCYTHWIEGVVEQCRADGVPCFVKQLGSIHRTATEKFGHVRMVLKNGSGSDPDEWPENLRVREFPASPVAVQ